MIESSDFVWNEYIKDDNILRAANFILTLDSRAIQKIHQRYAHRWLDNLRKQYEWYYQRTRKEYLLKFNESTRSTLIEQSNERLQQQIIYLASILTFDMQQQLLNYLADPNADIPKIFNNERNN